jgi:hypothetical protein
MRTIYLGDTYRRDHGRTLYRQSYHTVDAERAPRGDDIPVFDRRDTGGRDDYQRPWRDDDDGVYVRRLPAKGRR